MYWSTMEIRSLTEKCEKLELQLGRVMTALEKVDPELTTLSDRDILNWWKLHKQKVLLQEAEKQRIKEKEMLERKAKKDVMKKLTPEQLRVLTLKKR